MRRRILYPSMLLALMVISVAAARIFASPEPAAQQTVEAITKKSKELPKELVVDGKVMGEQIQAKSHEMCLVCNKPIGKRDVVYLVDGQRVPLHAAECYGAFLGDPQGFLSRVRPYGAFLDAGSEEQKLPWGWFAVGLYILVGLIFAAVCANQALHAGRSIGGWFATGLALNAFGYLLLITRPKLMVAAPGSIPKGLTKVPSTHAPEPCPDCGKTNHPSATECGGCGERLRPSIPSEVDRAGLHRD